MIEVPAMKIRALLVVAIIILTLCLVCLSILLVGLDSLTSITELSAVPVSTSRPLETSLVAPVVFTVAPTPTPAPPPPAKPRQVHYTEYSWDDEVVDALASIYWAECNTDAEKLAVTQLIYNRSVYGAPFKSGILGAAMQGKEFNRGHISDRNRENAVVNLNKVLTQAEGSYAGISVPASALYMRREGRVLVMLNAEWEEVWRGE